MSTLSAIVQEFWSYCRMSSDNTLLFCLRFGRHEGDAVEQERIVAEVERRLSVVELRGRHARLRGLSALVTANSDEESRDSVLQRATRLRQSILQRAFEGGLVQRDARD